MNEKKKVVLDTNILIEMIKRKDFCDKVLDKLSNYDLIITLYSIYELMNKGYYNNINCIMPHLFFTNVGWGKRVIEKEKIYDGLIDFASNGKRPTIYKEIKNIVSDMLKPVFCIFAHTYIYSFGLYVNVERINDYKDYICSDFFIANLKDDISNILEIYNVKKQKEELYKLIINNVKELLNKYGTYSNNLRVWISTINNATELSKIYKLSKNKKSKNLKMAFDTYFKEYIEETINKHYGKEYSLYLKTLYDKCFSNEFVIDINDLIDGFIVSSAKEGYYICSDDNTVKSYARKIGKTLEDFEEIYLMKKKYN